MSEKANLGVGICEKKNRRNNITGYLGICGHSTKENFDIGAVTALLEYLDPLLEDIRQ